MFVNDFWIVIRVINDLPARGQLVYQAAEPRVSGMKERKRKTQRKILHIGCGEILDFHNVEPMYQETLQIYNISLIYDDVKFVFVLSMYL